MISKIAEKAVDIVFSQNSLSQDDRELYVYGFFMLLSKVFYFLLASLFGVLFGIVIESILCYLLFSVLRSFAGGIHASKESICTVCTSLSLFSSVALIKLFLVRSFTIIPSCLLALSAITILLLSPLDTSAKRLSSEEKQEYRKKSVLCMSWIFLLAFFALALHIQSVFCSCSISLSLESILLLLGKHSTTKLNRRIH